MKSLGYLESWSMQLMVIQKTLEPKITKGTILLFAADHGVSDEDVSQYPKSVTKEMLRNLNAGGAAINALCNANGLDLVVRDKLCDRAGGVRDWNTTIAAALLLAVMKYRGRPGTADDVTGKGTGVTDERLEKKMDVIDRAVTLHQTACLSNVDLQPSERWVEVMKRLGGQEVAAMAAAAKEAANASIPVLVDGFISSVAYLMALLMFPESIPALHRCAFFSHKSHEKRHRMFLGRLKVFAVGGRVDSTRLGFGVEVGRRNRRSYGLSFTKSGCTCCIRHGNFRPSCSQRKQVKQPSPKV
ncbi:nicotinate-nucleotide-dimethylbenzimidazole phosphoribosyltransferase-like protein [Chytridium lagenaria]|nr:nicotinate-nucleotide-dimethylbenzimidazole phosphoribosyltransferase-like protein [Chytridium lagenaria]